MVGLGGAVVGEVDGGVEVGVVVGDEVGVDVGRVGCGVGVVGGASLKITSGLGVVVAGPPPVGAPGVVVAGAGTVVPFGRAPVAGGTVVVLPGDVVGDDVDVAPAIVGGGLEVDVVGLKMLVGLVPGWARAASPVDGLPAWWVVASATRPTTITATTTPITALERVCGAIPSHQTRSRSATPGRPKAALFPMDPGKVSRRPPPPGGGRPRRPVG